jgi:hypothetical protein
MNQQATHTQGERLSKLEASRASFAAWANSGVAVGSPLSLSPIPKFHRISLMLFDELQ